MEADRAFLHILGHFLHVLVHFQLFPPGRDHGVAGDLAEILIPAQLQIAVHCLRRFRRAPRSYDLLRLTGDQLAAIQVEADLIADRDPLGRNDCVSSDGREIPVPAQSVIVQLGLRRGSALPFLYRLHQLSGKQGAAVQIKRNRVLPAARRKQHAQAAQQHSQPIIANRFSHSSFLRSCICLYIL